MNPSMQSFNDWLPVIFMAVMGLAMLAYVILDGYDLGVGVLLHRANPTEKDVMISSIGPFWDANETWLVLGVGILLTCFPAAHGVILGQLYLPIALMLLGLTLRGVAFDFRVKVDAAAKPLWDAAFFLGSLIAALSQGWMLGRYIVGFDNSWAAYAFAGLIALCLLASYTLLGATWLVMKTEAQLQLRAVKWARLALFGAALGIAAVSIATPFVSRNIFDKWFSFPYVALLAPVPLLTMLLFFIVGRTLKRLPLRLAESNRYGEWVPFAASVGIFLMAFYGLAYSLFPYLVVDKMTIWQGATSPESMKIIFVGAAVVLPVIIGYTIFSYRVFSGKARELSYGEQN
jgi:cytochrome bd ubiquinol oxidase subunit II